MGLLFHPATPALSAATISKMPLNPLPPPPPSSLGGPPPYHLELIYNPTTTYDCEIRLKLTSLLTPHWRRLAELRVAWLRLGPARAAKGPGPQPASGPRPSKSASRVPLG